LSFGVWKGVRLCQTKWSFLRRNTPTSENLGTATFFEPFNSTVGYHGEVFVEPETGTVVRLIFQAELKPTDFRSPNVVVTTPRRYGTNLKR
jgi:hypothetical protein